jgi:hypothetical protein
VEGYAPFMMWYESGWAFGFNRNFGSVFAVFEQIRFSKMVTEIGMKI